jgi:hypothetical protein
MTPLIFTPAQAQFSVTGIQVTPVSITTTSPLTGGQKGTGYGPVTFAASGGIGSYSWNLETGSSLPSGLNLTTAGVLSGTPTVYGSFSFTIKVTSGPVSTTKLFTLEILPPAVGITTGSPLSGGTVGVPYSQTFVATGGTGSYTWSITAGSPPAGLILSSGGVLSGTPTASGTANFTVKATSGPVDASKAFELAIAFPTAINLAFQPGPSSSACYAINQVLVPNIAVKVTSTSGQPLSGVQVNIVAVTNNGAKVTTSQPFAITGADGRAVFNALSINKTGAYRLVASTQAPWPVKSLQSAKLNISPSCP